MLTLNKFGRFTPFFCPVILLEENWTESLLPGKFAVDHFYFVNYLCVNMSTWYNLLRVILGLPVQWSILANSFPTEQAIHFKVWARWYMSESTRKVLSQHLTVLCISFLCCLCVACVIDCLGLERQVQLQSRLLVHDLSEHLHPSNGEPPWRRLSYM